MFNTKGGMKGLTLKKGTIDRWLLSHHNRATIMKECKFMADKDQEGRVRKDLYYLLFIINKKKYHNICIRPFNGNTAEDLSSLLCMKEKPCI